MLSTCHCKQDDEYFDIRYLTKSKRKVDILMDEVRFKNPNLKHYYKRNNALKIFNDITLQLVKDFKNQAETYINFLINNKHEYGVLYLLSQNKLFNLLYIEYTTFPLIYQKDRKKIMTEIENIASQFIMNKITCLELLYFYALLVNSEYNWIIMDYITNGNKNHQYLMSEKR